MRVETVRRAAVFILKKGGGGVVAVDAAAGVGQAHDVSAKKLGRISSDGLRVV